MVPTYAPAWRYGGPIHAVHSLCRALVDAGHEVSVFTTRVDGSGDLDVPVGVPTNRDGVQVSYFDSPIARRTYWSPGMGRALRRHVVEYDLIHAHSVFLWPTWRSARAARSARRPFVLSPRGMLVPELISARSALLKRAWIGAIEWRNLRSAAVIHATSPLEAHDIERAGLALAPVRVVPNGVDVSANSESRRSGRTVLYLGRINWKKGLDRLIKAVAAVPDATLQIAGNDEESLRPGLELEAQRFGIASRVSFLGYADGEAKHRLLQEANVLVLPSLSENFGNVVVEAMAHACPVVVSTGVGAAKIVAECGGGLVCDGAPASLAAAITTILDRPEAAAEMGENGRRHVRASLAWAVVGRQMTELYAQALESVRP